MFVNKSAEREKWPRGEGGSKFGELELGYELVDGCELDGP